MNVASFSLSMLALLLSKSSSACPASHSQHDGERGRDVRWAFDHGCGILIQMLVRSGMKCTKIKSLNGIQHLGVRVPMYLGT